MTEPRKNVVYEFGDIRVDTALFSVERAGSRVDLEPKAFDLLVLLIRSQGRVVTKTEILDAIWGDTAVTDSALTRAVAQLRKAIGDDARDAKYVETVPTRGYRWLAEPRAAQGGHVAVQPAVRRSSAARLVPFVIVLAAVAALVGAAVVARNGAAPYRRLAGSLTPVQLTASPALDAFPSFSPDGKFLAYASNQGGGFEIAVRTLTGGAAERAVTADGQQNVQPAWSPDGTSIAYHSRRRGGIWIVSALGGAPRQVSEIGSDPAWSPDGRQLAFQSDPYIDILPTGYGANIPSFICVVDLEGRHVRQLTRFAEPIGAHAAPAWLPDGRRVAFASYGAGSARMWTVPADGGTPVLIEGLDGTRDPVFAADSTLYATTGGPSLRIARVSPDTGRIAEPPQEVLVSGISGARHVAISPDGRRLAFSAMDLTSHLWMMTVRDGASAGQPVPLTTDRARRQSEPTFSPDGSALAFLSIRGGRGAEIWTLDLESSRTTAVTLQELFNPEFLARPTWLHGGREIAFRVNGRESVIARKTHLDSRRATNLIEVPVDGSGRGRTPTAPDLTISPDGSRAAYSQVDPATGRSRLYVVQMSDRTTRAVTDGEAPVRFPTWSPDGRMVAFEIKTDEATNIAVVPADGGPARTLTSEPGESWPYGWSPDGEKILFAALRDGLWNLWWVSTRTGLQQRLTSNESANTFLRYPAWSPRGDRIAYELGKVTGNIWISQLPSSDP